ncbi:hypothetical protein HDU84_008079 [Entophlyctis sp. JEL0112]|nr:hypothetical protein HDU84_008079 [Entophlyctis sp. JEL0112]
MQGESLHPESVAFSVETAQELKHPKLAPGSAFSNVSVAPNAPISEDLAALAQEITAFKRHGDPPFLDVQSFAERVWRANLACETAIAKLDREKRMLTKQMDSIWGTFDTLIKPLWRVDDTIVPVYDALADIRIRLEDIHAQKMDLLASSQATEDQFEISHEELLSAQQRLHALEAASVVDGKFVGAGWRRGDPVPSGQAVVANLLAKCYRLVRMINESDPVVDKKLLPIQLRLENILRMLRVFKKSLMANQEVEPLELTSLQLQVDATADLLRDGKFLSTTPPTSDDADERTAASGIPVPKGQAVLREMLEDAYDMIHDCLVEMESRQQNTSSGGATSGKRAETAVMSAKVQSALESLSLATDTRQDEEQSAKYYSSLLTSPPAVQSLAETVSGAYSYVRAQTGSAVDASTAALAGLVRSSLASLGRVLALHEDIDPTLVPTYDRLVRLRATLRGLRGARDRAAAERLRAGGNGDDDDDDGDDSNGRDAVDANNRDGYEIRTHLAVLEELDMDRDRDGLFVNAEGGAPPQGQRQLKAVLEECFMLAYELL